MAESNRNSESGAFVRFVQDGEGKGKWLFIKEKAHPMDGL